MVDIDQNATPETMALILDYCDLAKPTADLRKQARQCQCPVCHPKSDRIRSQKVLSPVSTKDGIGGFVGRLGLSHKLSSLSGWTQ